MSKIFTKISLIFYILLTLFYIQYFSFASLSLFSTIISSILIYKYTGLRFFTFLRFPFLVVCIFIIYKEYGSWRGFEPASILFSTLVLLKIFELKTKRDIYSLILIQFLHVTSLSLLVEDFYYLPIIFTSLIVCFCNLYLVEQLSIEKAIISKSLKSILKFALFGSPLVILLFLAFPRFNFGGFLLSSNKAVTGFSEDLRPGDISEIVKDQRVIFHVKFENKMNRTDMYWRGQILAENDHFNWNQVSLPERRSSNRIVDSFDYSVTNETLYSGPLFTLEKTKKITLSSLGSLNNMKGDLFRSSPIRNQKARYKGWLGTDLPANLLKNYKDIYLKLSLPPNSKALKLLEKNIHLQSRPDAVAIFLKEFFKRSFSYSTSPGVYEGDNQLDDFLFDRKVGFCGHFASASASLFRLFGVASRVVVGYQGGIYNEVGDFYIVSEKDAHAWVEYLGADGIWTRFDAVNVISPARITYGADAFFEFEKLSGSKSNIEDFISNRSGILGDFQQYIQSMYYQTGTMFFNYDLETQRDIIKKIKNLSPSSLPFLAYFPYLFLIYLVSVLVIKRKKFRDILLFLCLNKHYSVKWAKFKVLNEVEMVKLILNRSDRLEELILMYQSLRYSRDESPYKELSFFFKAFKILIYG